MRVRSVGMVVVVAPRLMTPADTLGYAGFQFSGELGITTINSNRSRKFGLNGFNRTAFVGRVFVGMVFVEMDVIRSLRRR